MGKKYGKSLPASSSNHQESNAEDLMREQSERAAENSEGRSLWGAETDLESAATIDEGTMDDNEEVDENKKVQTQRSSLFDEKYSDGEDESGSMTVLNEKKSELDEPFQTSEHENDENTFKEHSEEVQEDDNNMNLDEEVEGIMEETVEDDVMMKDSEDQNAEIVSEEPLQGRINYLIF